MLGELTEDTASLRRDLIDLGHLQREGGGGAYWLKESWLPHDLLRSIQHKIQAKIQAKPAWFYHANRKPERKMKVVNIVGFFH